MQCDLSTPNGEKTKRKRRENLRRKTLSQENIRSATDAMKPVILPAIAKPYTKHAVSVVLLVIWLFVARQRILNILQVADLIQMVRIKWKSWIRDGYALTVKDGSKSSGILNLQAGGVELKDVLIDSAASCNVVDKITWESLKPKGVKCTSRRCSKKLFTYGQPEPIEVLGTFAAEIHCEVSAKSCLDEFTVVKGPEKTLLGKYTAEKLNILRVGQPSNPLACK